MALALAITWLSGCNSEPPASASEEKLTAEQTEAALKRKGYAGTPGPNNTELPRENGQVVPAIDTQSPPGVPYPDYLEKKSGFTHQTSYATPGLGNDTYSISSVSVSDEKYYHLKQTRSWTPYYEPQEREPAPAPYYPPSNPDNDDWSTPPAYTPPAANPDNDDWSQPSAPSYEPAPSNPDNDDWSGSLLLPLGIFGSSTAQASDLSTAILIAQCAQNSNFGYYPLGGSTYMRCGDLTFVESTETKINDDIRRSSVSVDFTVKGSGGTTSCNLTANSRLRSDRWTYDPSGLALNCDGDWAETTTNEKGKSVSTARTYANDLSQIIQGTAPAPVK